MDCHKPPRAAHDDVISQKFTADGSSRPAEYYDNEIKFHPINIGISRMASSFHDKLDFIFALALLIVIIVAICYPAI